MINNIQKYIHNLNIEANTLNAYLFIFMFLQRSQLIANIIQVINNNNNNNNYDYFTLGIKYNLINLNDYTHIIKKIKEFKEEFIKNDLIFEILNFLKDSTKKTHINNTLQFSIPSNEKNNDDKITPPKTRRISFLIQSFNNINDITKKIENDEIINENDVIKYIQSSNIELPKHIIQQNNIKIKENINEITSQWISFTKSNNHINSPIYQFIKNWISLS